MLMNKKGVIAQRVLAHINEKIAEAQIKCDEQHQVLSATFHSEVERLERKLEHDKIEVVDKLVEGIIGKLM